MLKRSPESSAGLPSAPGTNRRYFLGTVAASALALQSILSAANEPEHPVKERVEDTHEVWPKIISLPPFDLVSGGQSETEMALARPTPEVRYPLGRRLLTFSDGAKVVTLRKSPLIPVFGTKFNSGNPLGDITFPNAIQLPPAAWPKAWPYKHRHQFNDHALALGGIHAHHGLTSNDWILGENNPMVGDTNPMQVLLQSKFERIIKMFLNIADFDRLKDGFLPGDLLAFALEKLNGDMQYLLSGRIHLIDGKIKLVTKPSEGGNIVAMDLAHIEEILVKHWRRDMICFEQHREIAPDVNTGTQTTSIASPKE